MSAHDEVDFHPEYCEEESNMTVYEYQYDAGEEESDEGGPSFPNDEERILKIYLHFHLKPSTRYYSLEFRSNDHDPIDQNNNRLLFVWGDVYGLPLWSIPTTISTKEPGCLEYFDSTRLSEVVIRILMQTIEALNKNTDSEWAVLGMRFGNHSVAFVLEKHVSAWSGVGGTPIPDGVVRQVLLLTQDPERCDSKLGIVEENIPSEKVASEGAARGPGRGRRPTPI
ncbi:hypothetical protein L211DRAFT_841708 [Terfezia boudieri ATCC MYA-4762]|uniref:Uncharacterized protein n=1 Tax=Terfezia boudieri ATCC MYA-4762 TaxID=1051890 RepID=A0A3N4LFK9_9PEZI|nr:hypothetical protein L211DRAFT_841708 [Terfezia boudieri ATCC MYA-4762]